MSRLGAASINRSQSPVGEFVDSLRGDEAAATDCNDYDREYND
jgi:hypothetical protein